MHLRLFNSGSSTVNLFPGNKKSSIEIPGALDMLFGGDHRSAFIYFYSSCDISRCLRSVIIEFCTLNMVILKPLGVIWTILSFLLHLLHCIFLCPTVNSPNLIPRLSFSLSISACALLAIQSALILIEVNTPAIAILLATVGVVVSIPGYGVLHPKIK